MRAVAVFAFAFLSTSAIKAQETIVNSAITGTAPMYKAAGPLNIPMPQSAISSRELEIPDDLVNRTATPLMIDPNDSKCKIMRKVFCRMLFPDCIYHPVYLKDGAEQPFFYANLKNESDFIFGSCKTYFGTAGSTAGHYNNMVVP